MKKTVFRSSAYFAIVIHLLIAYMPVHSAVIIFDFNGVLVKKRELSALWHIGPTNFIGRFWPWKTERYLFDFLELLQPRSQDTPLVEHHGRKVPQLMCDWLSGTKSSQEILHIVQNGLIEHEQELKKNRTRKVLKATTKFMFTPHVFVKTIKPLRRGIKLFRALRELTYGNGQPMHRIYILSNWDPESFELLRYKPKIAQVLDAADGVMISGKEQMLKPDPAFFYHFFTNFGIDPDNELTIYIDDEALNISVARQLGKKELYAIHCTRFSRVREQLQTLHALPS